MQIDLYSWGWEAQWVNVSTIVCLSLFCWEGDTNLLFYNDIPEFSQRLIIHRDIESSRSNLALSCFCVCQWSFGWFHWRHCLWMETWTVLGLILPFILPLQHKRKSSWIAPGHALQLCTHSPPGTEDQETSVLITAPIRHFCADHWQSILKIICKLRSICPLWNHI